MLTVPPRGHCAHALLQQQQTYNGGSRGLMDRALDLKPEVTKVVGSNPGSGRKCPRLR